VQVFPSFFKQFSYQSSHQNISVISTDQKNLEKLISAKQVEEAAKLYERMCEANKLIPQELQVRIISLLVIIKTCSYVVEQFIESKDDLMCFPISDHTIYQFSKKIKWALLLFQLDLFRLLAYYNAKNIPLKEMEWPGARAFFQEQLQKREQVQSAAECSHFFYITRQLF
jgi:hypothetical protein